MTEAEFIDECLKDIADGHREQGKTPREFLLMLNPLERRSIAKALVRLGKLTVTQKFPRRYDWK